jgi:hypothetical protein
MKRVIIGALALTCVASLTSASRAEEGTMTVSDTAIVDASTGDVVGHVKRTPNTDVIVGGMFLLTSAYSFSAVAAGTSDVKADENLWVPVAGPWMDLAERPRCGGGVARPTCDNESVNQALIVTSGIVQGVGALQILGGLLFPKTEVIMSSKRSVQIAPSATGSAVGITAFGKF